jgi:phosphoenolpyruvate carboxykinase (GTP)
VDKELWKTEAEGIREFYKKFGEKLPEELMAELEKLEKNLE